MLFDGPITANAGGLFSVQGASRLGGDVSILASSVDLQGAVDSQGRSQPARDEPGLIRFGSAIGQTGRCRTCWWMAAVRHGSPRW